MKKWSNTYLLFCYIVCIKWITVMDVLTYNSVIIYHCIRKTVLSADNLSISLSMFHNNLFFNIAIKITYFIINIMVG